MNESKKIIRRTALVLIWTLFISLTVSGFISAYHRTRYVDEGIEYSTVKWSYETKSAPTDT